MPLAPGGWEVFKSLSDSLTAEMCELGFPSRLAGVWRKLEAYLARLALILCLSRVAESGAPERIESQDLLNAGRLIEYFKAHAKRVYVGLHGESQKDLLATELKEFLEECGGKWEGEPSTLREELVKRESEAVPSHPAELSKMVVDIAEHAPSLKAERAWGKKEGKSHRILRLTLKKPVDPVVPVDLEAGLDNTDHGINGSLGKPSYESPNPDNEDNRVYATSKDFIERNPHNGAYSEDDSGMDF